MKRKLIIILLCFFLGINGNIFHEGMNNLFINRVSAEELEESNNGIEYYKVVNEQIKKQEENKPDALLKDLHLGGDEDVEFKEDIYKYVIDVSENTEDILIKAQPKYKNDIVYVDGVQITSEDKFRTYVNLKKGKNLIKIEVEDSISNDIAYYYLYIYRGDLQYITLADMKIDDREMGFVPSKKFYNIELDEDDHDVRLQFKTLDNNYSIKVNDKLLNDTGAVKLKFNGINKYTVNVILIDNDSGKEVKYTLNFYVGIPISPDPQSSINEILKPNQWIIENGRWKYNDYLGNPLESTWFFDSYYNRKFYFNKRGYMQTGWMQIDNKKYYFNTHGAMQTGWVYISDAWYYFDNNGVMQTGWIFDKNKWYYLDTNGAMKCGWISDRGKWYYLNSDGSMKTGWIIYRNDYYYLGENGAAHTGWTRYNGEWYYMEPESAKMVNGQWLKYNNSWYYLNNNGTMRTGWLSKDNKLYYFNADGRMNTESKIIDGYMCNFNSDGSINLAI